MSLVPGIPNQYLAAFVMGATYGLAFCTSACLPYIAGYIAGVGGGFRRGVVLTLTYNSGRIVAYALIGAVIGIISGVLRFLLYESSFLLFQSYSSIAFGLVTTAIGVSILLKSRKISPESGCASKATSTQIKTTGVNLDVRAFTLGLSRGLAICPALLALLLSSLPFAAPFDGFALAVLFGIGTAISPLLLLGGTIGWLLNKAPLLRKWISALGGSALIILGIGTIIMSFSGNSR